MARGPRRDETVETYEVIVNDLEGGIAAVEVCIAKSLYHSSRPTDNTRYKIRYTEPKTWEHSTIPHFLQPREGLAAFLAFCW